jgi:hypothetical protein
MSTILHKGLGKFYKFFKASFREDLLTTWLALMRNEKISGLFCKWE